MGRDRGLLARIRRRTGAKRIFRSLAAGELVFLAVGAGFLEDEGVDREVAQATAVDEWAERGGAKIAGVTRARSVAGGSLVVEVRSSAWLMELNMMKGDILQRVNEGRDVPVEQLVFVLSPEA